MSHSRQWLRLRWKWQKNMRLIGLTLSVVLVLVGSSEAAVAQAAVAAEDSQACDMVADPETAFAVDEVTDAVALTRIGCARDAGSLRSLADSDNDLVMTVDVVSSEHRPVIRQLIAGIREYQDAGYTLRDYFEAQDRKYDSGAIAEPDRTPAETQEHIAGNFDGSVHEVGNSLVMVVPATEFHTAANWFEKIIAWVVGTAATVVVAAACLVPFPEFLVVCGSVSGFVGGYLGDLMNSYFDKRDLGSLDAQMEALAMGICGAVATGFAGELVKWAKSGIEPMVVRLTVWLKNFITKTKAYRVAAEFVLSYLSPMAPFLSEHVVELTHGIGTVSDLRVMPVGDSITAGVESSDNNGYRGVLHNALNAVFGDGQVDFVGSARTGTMSDPDHEGHPGWRIDEIASIADCKVAEYQPNVITLHAGTNDFNQNFDLSSAPQRMKNLITQALENSPKAVVVVAEVIPTAKAGLQPRIDAFNAALSGIVSDLRADGEHVVLTDTSDIYVSEGLQNDAHPDDGGYAKLGKDFYRGIMEAVGDGWIQQPDPQQPSPQCQLLPDDPSDVTALGDGWRKLGVIAPGMRRPASYDRTEIAEMNGDKRADYVQVRKDGSIRVGINTKDQPGQPTWKNWGGGTGEFSPAGNSSDSGTSFAPYIRFADIDGNGRDDFLVVLGSLDDSTLVDAWLNLSGDDGRPIWESMPRLRIPMKDAKLDHIRFADVNGDGRDDVLRVGDTGNVHAYFNNRTSGSSQPTWKEKLSWAPGVAGATLDNLQFADVNNDNKADYLMVGTDGSVHAYLNQGGKDAGGFEGHHNFANASNYPRQYIQFRDISGDGKADYLVVYHGGAVRAWLNRGGNL